jgi:hypothetical protein
MAVLVLAFDWSSRLVRVGFPLQSTTVQLVCGRLILPLPSPVVAAVVVVVVVAAGPDMAMA